MTNQHFRVILHTLSFSLGLLTFLTIIAFFSSWFQPLLFEYQKTTQIIAGLFLIIFGIILGEWIPVSWLTLEYRIRLSRQPSGFIGSYLVGLAFTAGWTPCIGPILGSVFTMAVTAKVNAFFVLLSYGLGLSIPFLLTGIFLDIFMSGYQKFRAFFPTVIKISSIILILTGIVLIFGGFDLFSERLYFIPSLQFLVENMSAPMFFLAFIGGILSFISPCMLPIVPSFLAYISGVSVIEEESHEQGSQ